MNIKKETTISKMVVVFFVYFLFDLACAFEQDPRTSGGFATTQFKLSTNDYRKHRTTRQH